jgi:pSer/pThr/pTyr-binding forkhead associated (FHA) protein/uncharacterized coiled-coil DUF342 family protein
VARLDLRKIKHVSRLDLAEKLGDKPISIGRSSSNEVVLADTHVSRHHCIIEIIEGETRIRDLKSHGGTFVNGHKIEQATLHHGDRISVGPFDLLYKDPSTAHTTNGELPLALASEDTDSSRSATGIRLSSPAGSIPDPDIEAKLAELETREAQLNEREASLQAQRAEIDQKRFSALKQDAERIASLQKELDRARAENVVAADRIAALLEQARSRGDNAEDLRSQLTSLSAERDEAHHARAQAAAALAELRDQVASFEAQMTEHATQIDELQTALKNRQEQLDQLQRRFAEQSRSLEQSLDHAQREIERLKTHEATLQEQVETLESARRIVADRAEQSGRALATLRGQVRSLDDAAQRVTAIQSRLAEIESAFVDLDQQMENAQDQDDEQLEQVVTNRQQISEELEALNEVRDAAVAQLSESAQHLRTMTDQQLMQIAAARPTPRMEPTSARSTATAEHPGRRWWKFGR